MKKFKTDYDKCELNASSAKTLKNLYKLLASKPLGTALIIGKDAFLFIPLPAHTRAFSDVWSVRKSYLGETHIPAPHNFELLITPGLSDHYCLLLDKWLDTPKFEKVEFWSNWLIESFLEAGLINSLQPLIKKLIDTDTMTIDDFTKLYNRKVKGV